MTLYGGDEQSTCIALPLNTIKWTVFIGSTRYRGPNKQLCSLSNYLYHTSPSQGVKHFYFQGKDMEDKHKLFILYLSYNSLPKRFSSRWMRSLFFVHIWVTIHCPNVLAPEVHQYFSLHLLPLSSYIVLQRMHNCLYRLRSVACSASGSKACREKLRRDKLNDRHAIVNSLISFFFSFY